MPVDDGSPNDDRPASDAPAISDRPGGTRRPLGRGLEEISHLFLSGPRAPRASAPHEKRASNDLPGGSEGRLGVSVLRAGTPIAKSQLTATLKEYPGGLQADLSVVATNVPCPPYGDIDLIGVGAAHEAIVIDVESEPSDRLLLRGLGHVDWLAANLSTVRSLCPTWAIDGQRRPGLFLVAPRFSSEMRRAIRQIDGPAIACFVYRDIALAAGTGIFLERLGDGAD